PSNVWLEAPRGRVKLLDFGLAREQEGGEILTHSGAVMGTPGYMAPEQARGEKVDARADLFSLGCILDRLCTGAPPFSAPTLMSLWRARGPPTPPAPAAIRRDVPPELSALITRLLSKDPAGRLPNARAVADEIIVIARAINAAPSASPV